ADARFGSTHHGAFTYNLVDVLQRSRHPASYEELIRQVGQNLYDRRFLQEPQLHCSDENRQRPFLNRTARQQPTSSDTLSTDTSDTSGSAGAETTPIAPSRPSAPPPIHGNMVFEKLLPHEAEQDAGFPGFQQGPKKPFLYIGYGLTADEFTAYLEQYSFGATPPDSVIVHHTSVPGLGNACTEIGNRWDADEENLNDAQIYFKRLQQLRLLRNYYANQLKWDRGPHLFIDDRYIWLFTPMYHWGIHTATANFYYGHGQFRHSIGLVVIGHYDEMIWSPSVEYLVGHAIAVLKQRLGSFEIRHHVFSGGISSHRDYGHLSCPGEAISDDYLLEVARTAWKRLQAEGNNRLIAPELSLSSPLQGPASGRRDQLVNYVVQRLPMHHEYRDDVDLIMSYYWHYAHSAGLDPFLAAAQCVLETDALRSAEAARPQRNPARLQDASGHGLAFRTWDESVQVHLGYLLGLTLQKDPEDAQRKIIRAYTSVAPLPSEQRGRLQQLADFDAIWSHTPGYAQRLLELMHTIQKGNVTT
ncbi:MAG: hypothetical protein HC837_19425, partial [Chloroflexaceae bacterium]|nr:hypothetical protein [Chloroflexaceae bacterium]